MVVRGPQDKQDHFKCTSSVEKAKLNFSISEPKQVRSWIHKLMHLFFWIWQFYKIHFPSLQCQHEMTLVQFSVFVPILPKIAHLFITPHYNPQQNQFIHDFGLFFFHCQPLIFALYNHSTTQHENNQDKLKWHIIEYHGS